MQLSEETDSGRRAAMAVLAQADTAGIERGLLAADCAAEFVDLRAPEIGLVMLRGRIGGNGAPFNVGEATVTRAAVQLASGEQGFAYILGRDPKKARLAALFATVLAMMGSRTTRINGFFSVLARGLASVFRNTPLVAWAMILMLAFSQSLITGYLALFFGSLGFLTRAFIETVDEASIDAVEALQATGASYSSIILQAVLPSSLPQMISWLLFMIDTNIRDATLVGLLTGTGVGFSFDLYYKNFQFHNASLVVVLIVVTILVIEMISNYIRRIIL